MSWLVASPFGLCLLPHAPAPAAHLVTYFNIYLSESASLRVAFNSRQQEHAPQHTHTHTLRPHAPHTATSSSVVVCVCAARHASSVAALQGGE